MNWFEIAFIYKCSNADFISKTLKKIVETLNPDVFFFFLEPEWGINCVARISTSLSQREIKRIIEPIVPKNIKFGFFKYKIESESFSPIIEESYALFDSASRLAIELYSLSQKKKGKRVRIDDYLHLVCNILQGDEKESEIFLRRGSRAAMIEYISDREKRKKLLRLFDSGFRHFDNKRKKILRGR